MSRWMRTLRWFGLARPLSHAGVRVVDMDSAIHTLDPSTSTFTTLLMQLPSRLATGAVEWLEDEFMPRINATYWDHEWAWVD